MNQGTTVAALLRHGEMHAVNQHSSAPADKSLQCFVVGAIGFSSNAVWSAARHWSLDQGSQTDGHPAQVKLMSDGPVFPIRAEIFLEHALALDGHQGLSPFFISTEFSCKRE